MDEITFEYFLENPRGRCLEKHVASKFPELYKKIKDLPGKKFSEKIYIYFKGPGKCAVLWSSNNVQINCRRVL